MPNGIPIHGRLAQQLLWGVILTLATVAVIACWYYLIVQVRWDIFGHVIWLKPHWDNLIHRGWWMVARHDYRNVYEGVGAKLIVGSVVTTAWTAHAASKPLRGRMVIPWLLLILAVSFVLVTAAIYVLDLGGPSAWHYLFGNKHLTLHWTPPTAVAQVLAGFQWQPFLIGVLAGFPIKKLWQPAGRTIVRNVVDRIVIRARKTGRTPAVVRYPIAPPNIREEAAWIIEQDLPVAQHRSVAGWVPILVLAVYVASLGGGEYVLHVIAHAHH
jgi:hypothetical protein